jgi:hypothetical protein
MSRYGALARWRDGGSNESWPSLWDRSDKWPTLDTEPWVPPRAGPALIVCERDGQPMTYRVALPSNDESFGGANPQG